MSDAFRTEFIRACASEILSLSGDRFEQFAYRVLDLVHPHQSGSWTERGTTITGSPGGYAIDSCTPGTERELLELRGMIG